VSAENRKGFVRESPWIQVRLTAFIDPAMWDTASIPIQKRLNPARCTWLEIPIGLFPGMHVGQVWKAGDLQPLPRYEYAEFPRVHIRNRLLVSDEWRDDYTCEIVWDSSPTRIGTDRFSLVPDDVLRVQPPGRAGLEWRDEKGKKSSPGIRCLRVALQGTASLVIPCAEIARFYYANSSNFANALFSGLKHSEHDSTGSPRHLDEIYNLAESQVTEGVHHIQLRMRFEKEDALIAARLRYDDNARRRALAIGARLDRAEFENWVPLVEAEIPFEGTTDLGVHGTWMETEVGGVTARIFYVFWMEKCTGPWPFSKVICSRDSPDTRPTDGGEDDGEGSSEVSRRPGVPKPQRFEGEIIIPEPPSMLTGLRKVKLDPPRFEPPPLGKVPVEYPSVSPTGRPSGWAPAGPEPPTEGVSPQPGTYGEAKQARLSIIRNIADSDPELKKPEEVQRVRLQLNLQTFREAVARLTVEQGWPLHWRSPDGGTGHEAPVFPADHVRKRPAWCYIERDKSGQMGTPRHVLIAEMQMEDSFVYLLEAERRKNDTMPTLLLMGPAGNCLEDGFFSTLLERCVTLAGRGKGIWGEPIPAGSVVYEKLIHPRRIEEAASVEEQENYTVDFAQHLKYEVEWALRMLRQWERRTQVKPRQG
jgi:hypothetical protein